jgi:hypothetical protein
LKRWGRNSLKRKWVGIWKGGCLTARRYTKKCQRKPNWIYHPNPSSKEAGLADTHEIAQTSEHRETDQERERERERDGVLT